MAPAPPSAQRLSPFDPRAALGRLGAAITVSVLVMGALSAAHFSTAVSALGAWDAGGLAWIALAWLVIGSADAEKTRARAGAEDPGRRTAYAVLVLTSSASLFAATILSRHVKALAAEGEASFLIALCLGGVVIAWGLTHTTFTLRYAHLYYREDTEGIGGVEFVGGIAPTYFDFAYFAFTIGMCFQVSDTCVSSPQIRRTVLGHALLSFAYTTVILAFVLNLVFGAATG